MNLTATLTANLRKILAGVALTAATLAATAGGSGAATLNYVHNVNTNNAIGQVSAGQALISMSNTAITVSGYLIDKRDGYFVTLQVRPLVRFSSTGLQQWGQWRNIGTTGVESLPGTWVNRTNYAAVGTQFTDAEVRLCQTNASGGIPSGARCTVVIPLDYWQAYWA